MYDVGAEIRTEQFRFCSVQEERRVGGLARLPTRCFTERVRLQPRDEEHVPRPASELRATRVFDLRAIAELIAVPVGAPRLLVIKLYRSQPEFAQRVQLARLRDAVVIHVLSQTQRVVDAVLPAYHAVGVAAMLGLVELGQRDEPVRVV